MRRLECLIAASLLAAPLLAGGALAQVAPSPDSPGMGDKTARSAPTAAQPTDMPVSPDAGIPSDVHGTPPREATQAPPATPADTAPTNAKAKGRAKPSSSAKKPVRP